MFSYLIIITQVLFAQAERTPGAPCSSWRRGTPSVAWTAYKFTEKTAVAGRLKGVIATVDTAVETIDEMMAHTSFEVDALGVETDNPARDLTLRENFFKAIKGGKIKGKIVAVKNDIAKVELLFNGVQKTIDFTVKKTKGLVTATGTIDVLDFALSAAFEKLHSACKELHKGKDGKSKTWSTVDLTITAEPVSACTK